MHQAESIIAPGLESFLAVCLAVCRRGIAERAFSDPIELNFLAHP